MKRLLALAMTAFATQLSAQSVTCLPRDALVESLGNTHGEHLTGGIACIVATGANWHSTVK